MDALAVADQAPVRALRIRGVRDPRKPGKRRRDISRPSSRMTRIESVNEFDAQRLQQNRRHVGLVRLLPPVLLRLHPHIVPRRVAERLQLALAGLAGGDFLRRLRGEPGDPVGPPGARRLLGRSRPSPRTRPPAARPSSTDISACRRIDDAGDMAGAGHHVAHRAAEAFGAGEHRAGRGDVVFARRQIRRPGSSLS